MKITGATKKITNMNEEVLNFLNNSVGTDVNLTCNTKAIQFNYYGRLVLRVISEEDEEDQSFMVCREDGPEIYFYASAVRKVYVGPSRIISIYL